MTRIPTRNRGGRAQIHSRKGPALIVGTAGATHCVIEAEGMNRTEAAFAQNLESLREHGDIQTWGFESTKLRIAHGAWYTPDFEVLDDSGQRIFYEVKGHWEEAARVRIKVAATLRPWDRFVAVKKQPKRDGGGWEFETIPAHPMGRRG